MSAVKKSTATTNVNHNEGRKVAIIGGGIGGLTAALAFAGKGAKVTVYEQAKAISEIGAGVQITPNGGRVLNRLLLGEAFAAMSIRAEAVAPHDGLSGKCLARFDLTSQTPSYRFCHRAALIDLLGRACEAKGVSLRLNTRIDAIDDEGSFEVDGQLVKADLTIGADGLKSVVREVINVPDDPFFTGQVAWRAIVKQQDADPVARIWMLPGRHVVTYPLPQGRMNVVAVQARSQWADEGWAHSDEPGNLRAAFADSAWQIKSLLAEVEHCGLWGLFRHPVVDHWYRGQIALLGDAAHPTLPFLAQGANLALEDAYCLARMCNESETLEDGLSAYKRARDKRVRRAIAAANRNAVNYHLKGLARTIAHSGLQAIGRAAPGQFVGRLGWLYDHDVTE